MFDYLKARRRGLDHDLRRDIYKKAGQLTLDDIMQFQEAYLSGKPFSLLVMGHRDQIDQRDLQKYGEVRELVPEELFGYGEVNPEGETTVKD